MTFDWNKWRKYHVKVWINYNFKTKAGLAASAGPAGSYTLDKRSFVAAVSASTVCFVGLPPPHLRCGFLGCLYENLYVYLRLKYLKVLHEKETIPRYQSTKR
jgi:hypothetical protein